MTKIINGFAHYTTAMLAIRGHLRHNEIGLPEGSSFGVYTDKNFCNFIYIKRVVKLDNAYLPISYTLQHTYRFR